MLGSLLRQLAGWINFWGASLIASRFFSLPFL